METFFVRGYTDKGMSILIDADSEEEAKEIVAEYEKNHETFECTNLEIVSIDDNEEEMEL